MGLKAGDEVELEVAHGGLLVTTGDEEFDRQVAHAERFMERYRVVLKKLAE